MTPMPHSPESEQSILAACMLGGAKEAVGLVTFRDFYASKHQLIFRAVEKIVEGGGPVELASIVAMLKSVNKLDEAGGAAYVASLIDVAPAAVSIEYYCTIIKDKAAKRRLIEQCNAVMAKCYEDGDPAEISEAARKIGAVDSPGFDRKRIVDISNVYDSARMLDEYRRYVRTLKDNRFITGIHEIDKRIRGVGGGEVMFIIARAGAYKTALLQNMLRNYCNASSWCSLFFSLEMPVANICERYLQMVDSASGQDIEAMYRRSENEMIEAVERVFSQHLKRLYVVPTKVGLDDMARYCKLIEKEHKAKVGLIGIDYLGLLDHPGRDEYDIVSKAARGIKDLAKHLNVPVIVLSQTSRKGGEGQTEITLDMGRGSGAIEEAGDFLLGLWKDDADRLICKVLKNRKGPINSRWVLDLAPESFAIGPDATEYVEPKKQAPIRRKKDGYNEQP